MTALRFGAVILALCAVAGCGDEAPCAQREGALAEGVVRFLPPGTVCASLPPSLALVAPSPGDGAIPPAWATVPSFHREGERHVATLAIDDGTSLYGTGEIAGPLLRNGFVTESWAEQTIGYDDSDDHLYQAHPWVLAVRPDGSAFGVLADTTRRLRIDLGGAITLSAEAPFPVIVIEGATPQEVLVRLTDHIGRMELPPLWSLGYHQSRYSYTPDDRVREIASELRSRALPSDVIWMDIDYMDRFRVFTFDPFDFPDPAALNQDLHDLGFKAVWMIDPCVAEAPGYSVYDEGTAGDHWLEDAEGEPYVGRVWPGRCVFPDYTRPETRAWWASLYGPFMATGIDGVWNDMNEPSSIIPPFNPPNDLWHRGGGGLPAGDHGLYHNAYGLLMTEATRQGMRDANPGARPFLLTRSTFIGGHRYAATWTGDNGASWDHLRWSVTMILNLGLSAQPFVGPDIGGFFAGDGADDVALFAHFMGAGAFFPFMRSHTSNLSADREPWAFGAAVEATSRTALERRYRLLPYLYTLFDEASKTGLPVMRPVFFAAPGDPALRAEDHAFLLGADLLVEPSLLESGTHAFARPAGAWRAFDLVGEDPSADPAQPVLRIRDGAIVPLGRVVQSTNETLLEPLTLVVSLDEQGEARGRLYEDAGEGYAYRDGDYLETHFVATTGDDGVVRVRIEREEGERPRPARTTEVVVVIDGGQVVTASGDEVAGIDVALP